MIKKLLKWTIITFILVVGTTAIWMSVPFDYQQQVTEQSLSSSDTVTVSTGDFIEFKPAFKATVGIIFYPGGKTTASTFAPLMHEFARQGFYSAITPMPLKTAFLGIDKANDVIAANPTIKHWYIAGHSLGGVAAAEYVKTSPQSVKGLLLWASYPGSDISNLSIAVHSLSAGKDLQSTPDKIAINKVKLPTHTVYQVIENANHWQYGHYQDDLNEQQGLISRAEQQQKVVVATVEFIEQTLAK
ncbi:alpha/beta hydrolase [Thalassotalea psychrophila]|uniref:Alpha/beta hydrolase n=1 Tax=Thalassotalea psychrophila TaxID=3065647 RepID=A0ABY9TWM2_9GAMM|nr:alpha/beta hydrolase [Colwelliaceae bacterium SQ149]